MWTEMQYSEYKPENCLNDTSIKRGQEADSMFEGFGEILTDEQRAFLEINVKKSRQDCFFEKNVRLRNKFSRNPTDEIELLDRNLDEWVYVDMENAGAGNRSKQCECGKKVQYLYIVKNVYKETMRQFGSECFKKFMGIDPQNYQKLSEKSIEFIAEVREIVSKLKAGEFAKQKFLLDFESLPTLSKSQLELCLPLSSKQLKRALTEVGLNDEYPTRKMNKRQLDKLNQMESDVRKSVIAILIDGSFIESLDELLDTPLEKIKDREIKLKSTQSLDRVVHSKKNERTGWHPPSYMMQSIYNIKENKSEEEDKNTELIRKAGKKLGERGNEKLMGFWRSSLSTPQRIELATSIINEDPVIDVRAIGNFFKLSPTIQNQIMFGLPLTAEQMKQVQLKSL